MIVLAYEINEEAHRLSGLSQEAYYRDNHDEAWEYSYQKEYQYSQKEKVLKKIILYIKNNKISIKYWNNNWIIYFAFWKYQLSFHHFINFWKGHWKTFMQIKKYNWKWSNRPNDDNIIEKIKKSTNKSL